MSRTSERRQRRLQALEKQNSGIAALGRLRKPAPWLYIGIGVLAVVVLIGVVSVAQGNSRAASPSTAVPGGPSPAPGTLLGREVQVPDQGGQHIKVGDPHAAYNSTPPTSGPHYENAAPWTSPTNSPLPEELWIHNLEHSGIVALYNCPQGCADMIAKLDNFRRTGPRSRFGYMKMLILPYDKSDAKLTLVAWGYYVKLADFDEALVRDFVVAHQDKGPEPNTP